MNRSRNFIALMAAVFLFAPGTVVTDAGCAQEAPGAFHRFGVFPLWLSLGEANALASEELASSLTAAILSDLQNSEVGEWIPLRLPESPDDDSRASFDTLIGQGLETGCSGILVLQAHQLDFRTKEIEIGRMTFISASCDVALSGSLIDVHDRTAVCEFASESRLKDGNYTGPEPEDVESEPVDSEDVRKSLLGRAIAEVRQDLFRKIVQNASKIRTRVPPLMSRSRAPGGVRFLQETADLSLSAAPDQRFTVQVMNAGDETETFIVKPLNQISGVVVGLKGLGSPDEPCRLNPGEWKFIRLVANARPNAAPGAVVLGLVTWPRGEGEGAGMTVHDRMTLNLAADPGRGDMDLKILRQDPATLRYVCQVFNRSREEGSVSLKPGESTGGSILITPVMEETVLAAGRSAVFYVEPVFKARSRRIEADVQCDLGGRMVVKHLVFDVPPGKERHWGSCGTSQSVSGSPGVCLNIGTISLGFTSPLEVEYGKLTKLRLGQVRAWLGRTFGSDDFFEAPDHGNIPSGIRGSRVRASVESCLPVGVGQDSTTCPSSATGSDFLALVSHRPTGSTTGVFYDQISLSSAAALETRSLSEEGHSALWPEIAVVRESDEVFSVWEDAVDSSGTAIALRRKSGRGGDWSDVQYLTDHSRRLIDPVVCASASGSVAVAWEEQGERGHRLGVRLSADGGRTFMPEFALPRRPDESQSWPRCAYHPSGRWVFVYRSGFDGRGEIVCAVINREGRVAGEAKTIFAGSSSCGEPRLAVNEDGDIFVVWRVGEGDSSEIWFSLSASAGAAWSPPQQVTTDARYSEYPKVKAFGDTVLVSYHAPVLDGRDLTFQTASFDRGKSWQRPKALISTSPWVERASLELHLSLSWPRGDYRPFDTLIYVNGEKVGEIPEAVPEGIYCFDVPGDLVRCNTAEILDNEIKIVAPGINPADNIILKSHRLVVKRRLTQIPVFASDQREADRLAREYSADVNHGEPDLSLSANRLHIPSRALRRGEKLKLDFEVRNLGEAAAENVRLLLFRSDPSLAHFDERTEKLAEVDLKTIRAGQTQIISSIIDYQPEAASCVHALVRTESNDFHLMNNGFRLSLIDGESDQPTPLLGTDIPSLFQAPSLLNVLKIRDLDGLKDFISSSAFNKFWNSELAGSIDLEEIKGELRERFINGLRERFLSRFDALKDALDKWRDRDRR